MTNEDNEFSYYNVARSVHAIAIITNMLMMTLHYAFFLLGGLLFVFFLRKDKYIKQLCTESILIKLELSIVIPAIVIGGYFLLKMDLISLGVSIYAVAILMNYFIFIYLQSLMRIHILNRVHST